MFGYYIRTMAKRVKQHKKSMRRKTVKGGGVWPFDSKPTEIEVQYVSKIFAFSDKNEFKGIIDADSKNKYPKTVTITMPSNYTNPHSTTYKFERDDWSTFVGYKRGSGEAVTINNKGWIKIDLQNNSVFYYDPNMLAATRNTRTPQDHNYKNLTDFATINIKSSKTEQPLLGGKTRKNRHNKTRRV